SRATEARSSRAILSESVESIEICNNAIIRWWELLGGPRPTLGAGFPPSMRRENECEESTCERVMEGQASIDEMSRSCRRCKNAKRTEAGASQGPLPATQRSGGTSLCGLRRMTRI